MTHTTTHHWVCDNCGRSVEVSGDRPEGWQYVYKDDGLTLHACQRECAKALLVAEIEVTLDRWYPGE